MTRDLVFTLLAGSSDVGRRLVVGPSLGTSVGALWGDCAAELAADFEVVGWDLPGHGSSPPATTAFSIDDLAGVVRGQLVRQGGRRETWYAGVSLGGAVGFQLALEPGPIRGVVAIASAPRIGEAQSWTERAELVARSGMDVMVEPSAGRWFAPGFTAREPAVSGALLSSLAEADPYSYALACLALRDFDLTAQVATAKVPVLVLPGAEDKVITVQTADTLSAAVPDRDFEIVPAAAHLPPAERPAVTAAMIRAFINRRSE